MMTENESLLVDTIEATNQGWLLPSGKERTNCLAHLTNLLRESQGLYKQMYPDEMSPIPPLDIKELVKQREGNPHRISAFLQGLGSASRAEMLVVVWRILHGDAIKAITMTYEMEQSFSLCIIIEDQVLGRQQSFRTENIDDAALLRHLGIMHMSGKPVFDGFYALKM